MGIGPFRNLMADPRFQQVPMYLETPKDKEDGVDMDVVNLDVLRSLIP
jgi:deoxyribonuclease-4